MGAVNNAEDGNLTVGWHTIRSRMPPVPTGGPSISHNSLDGKYYLLTGGKEVNIVRTSDFLSWELSSQTPFINPSPDDAVVSPYAGFHEVVAERGFDLMSADWKRWDWNSNDADVCC